MKKPRTIDLLFLFIPSFVRGDGLQAMSAIVFWFNVGAMVANFVVGNWIVGAFNLATTFLLLYAMLLPLFVSERRWQESWMVKYNE